MPVFPVVFRRKQEFLLFHKVSVPVLLNHLSHGSINKAIKHIISMRYQFHMWPPVQTLQISLQCVWLTLALLSLIPCSPILHYLSPQYIVNFIHFYLIGILNCLKLCIHLHFHRTPFLLSSLYIHIPR